MYGNKGLEAHIDNNHTIGISLLCIDETNNFSIIKKWIIIDIQYIKKLFGNSGNIIEITFFTHYLIILVNFTDFYSNYNQDYNEIESLLKKNPTVPYYQINQPVGTLLIVPVDTLHVTKLVSKITI